jgi:hypothetical protein
MTPSDPRANNLFARLFTYAPRPTPEEAKYLRQRNALEDFCTEAVAWCLIRSKPFADALFGTLDMFLDTFELDTQLSFSGEANEYAVDGSGRSRFDLVVKSSAPESVVVVIECKVAFDQREKINDQVGDYRRHLRSQAFSHYRKKLIVLLTPFADKHAADFHLSWNEVYEVLDAVVNAHNDAQEAVLQQFADFLKIRHLAKMRIPPITPLLPSLKAVGPLLAGLESIFESLRNDEPGRSLFRRDAMLPKMDWDEKGNKLWYGIWSRGPRPTYFVGFDTTFSGAQPLSMWVEVFFEGDRASETVPENLKKWYMRRPPQPDGTSFVFTKEIEGVDDDSAAIEEWLQARLQDVKAWADGVG